MKNVVVPGVVLGALAIGWMYVNGLLGWYKRETLEHLFVPVIMAVHVGVLIWALRAGGRQGATYGTLVKQGTLISVVAALLIFVGSLSWTTLAFPNCFEEVRALHAQVWPKSMKEDELTQALDMERKLGKPLIAAGIGAFMTVLVGFLASLVIALFTRRRPDKA